MPGVGVEPTRGFPQRFLRPPCLPFHHPGNAGDYTYAAGLPSSSRSRHASRIAYTADMHDTIHSQARRGDARASRQPRREPTARRRHGLRRRRLGACARRTDARIVADARPNTAVAPIATTRVGRVLDRDDEPEAYEALASATRRRASAAASFAESPTPHRISDRRPRRGRRRARPRRAGRGRARQDGDGVHGRCRGAARLAPRGPLSTCATAHRSRPRDARVTASCASALGQISYASPNSVNIMRLAGVDRHLTGTNASGLPGEGSASRRSWELAARLRRRRGRRARARLSDHRACGGALVLVDDLTEQRRREDEIKVKEATIREVHHRVKNNLQTIATLLRIQARRTE